MTRQDVIDYLEFLQEQEHAKADSILPTCNEMALGIAIEALKQPEIVRCKDCCRWLPMNRFHEDYHPGRGDCELMKMVTDSDWFCSEGKKRSD